MKQKLFFFISIVATLGTKAQEPADALRYSWITPSGTARQQAIGGAMTSLGGDVTATFVNPAGLAFYRTGDFVFSPGYRFGKTKSTYLDRQESNKDNSFSLGTTGFVAGSGYSSNKKVRNTAFSIGFNTMANFNSNVLYRGENRQTSFSQKFLEEVRNSNTKDYNRVAEDFPFGSSLAFNAYLIDTIPGGTANNYQFESRAANILNTGLLQEQSIEHKGGIYEFALGLAANFNDKLLLGGSFGIPFLNYKREASFTEADATFDRTNRFDFATFSETLSTVGAGFNARLGLIYKPKEFWRLGLVFHTPTVYSLTDKYEALITADVERPDGKIATDLSTSYTNNAPSEFKYTLVTPYKVTGSISYVLREIQDVTKQRGFLTADVEYVNYKASSFHVNNEEGNTEQSTKDYLKSLNQAVDNAFKGAFNFKAGGELKFTTIMVRAGAAYFGNPYKNVNGEKGSKLNLSGGLGYRDKGYFIDLTYIYSIYKDIHTPYRLQYTAYENAKVKANANNVVLTFGFKF